MGFFKDISEPLVSKNVPVIPLRPKTKVAFIAGWENIASTDSSQIAKWDTEFPGANIACVAKAQPGGVWFFEVDRPDVTKKIKEETGHSMPVTFTVRSSPGRGHFYFRQNALSIAMGNMQAKDDKGEMWSARVDNRYVVGPGSFHPTSGKQYELLRDAEIVEAPEWLIQWCAKQPKPQYTSGKTGIPELDDDTPILEGGRNNALASILGRARQLISMDRDQLFDYGKSVNAKRCNPPLSDSEIRTIANSIGSYAVKPTGPRTVILGGVPGGMSSLPPAVAEAIERPKIKPVPYPVWPEWVMKGTSIYEGLVKPICDKNSRYPEYMFLPAVTVMLNYLGQKVRIEYKNITPSFFMISIGRKGRIIKSSSVQDAIEYMRQVGVADYAGNNTKNAEGKSLVWSAGSPEGLGLEMSRTNCKNAVLFYDELSGLVNKAGIDSSSLAEGLLKLYESGRFANTIKSRKESYSFEPNTYCASLIACTTDQNFSELWGKLPGNSSGLDERFFFLYQPENFEDLKLTPYYHVDTKAATVETRKRIDKAVARGVFSIVDHTPFDEMISKLGNRTEGRAEKLALYFAVDLGKDEIDEDCVERALAICKYELAAKKYLQTFETDTQEGSLQNRIIHLLRRNKGVMGYREIERQMNILRYGTSMWYKSYIGLVRSGWIVEEGDGSKGSPKQVILMHVPEEE